MATALASALDAAAGPARCRHERRDHAARAVLPIGGVREKVLAAYRLHLHTVIIPVQNRKDLVDVPIGGHVDRSISVSCDTWTACWIWRWRATRARDRPGLE